MSMVAAAYGVSSRALMLALTLTLALILMLTLVPTLARPLAVVAVAAALAASVASAASEALSCVSCLASMSAGDKNSPLGSQPTASEPVSLAGPKFSMLPHGRLMPTGPCTRARPVGLTYWYRPGTGLRCLRWIGRVLRGEGLARGEGLTAFPGWRLLRRRWGPYSVCLVTLSEVVDVLDGYRWTSALNQYM